MKKQVKRIHSAIFDPIADLDTWRAMPTGSVDHLDPFLFLNHHGPQHYGPMNNGLPFGPHPHRGFETLTFVLQGDIMHKDSIHGESIIVAGGIQWMTAGKGLVHAEVSSEEFKQSGGTEEVIQIWLNLPAALKMVPPTYTGLNQDEIPSLTFDEVGSRLHLISGTFQDYAGPVESLTQLFTSYVDLEPGGAFQDHIESGNRVLFYVIRGKVQINGQEVQQHQLVELDWEGTGIQVLAGTQSQFIYCYGKPFDEPIVAHGPFVMNSQEEIMQAFADYQAGKLGVLR